MYCLSTIDTVHLQYTFLVQQLFSSHGSSSHGSRSALKIFPTRITARMDMLDRGLSQDFKGSGEVTIGLIGIKHESVKCPIISKLSFVVQ